MGVWEGVKREPGEEVKKRRVEERTESAGAEFPLVPFLRRLNQIPTSPGPHSTLLKPEPVNIQFIITSLLYIQTDVARQSGYRDFPWFFPSLVKRNSLIIHFDNHLTLFQRKRIGGQIELNAQRLNQTGTTKSTHLLPSLSPLSLFLHSQRPVTQLGHSSNISHYPTTSLPPSTPGWSPRLPCPTWTAWPLHITPCKR